MIKTCLHCKGEGQIFLGFEEDIYRGYILKTKECENCDSLGFIDTRKVTSRTKKFRIYQNQKKNKHVN